MHDISGQYYFYSFYQMQFIHKMQSFLQHFEIDFLLLYRLVTLIYQHNHFKFIIHSKHFHFLDYFFFI